MCADMEAFPFPLLVREEHACVYVYVEALEAPPMAGGENVKKRSWLHQKAFVAPPTGIG